MFLSGLNRIGYRSGSLSAAEAGGGEAFQQTITGVHLDPESISQPVENNGDVYTFVVVDGTSGAIGAFKSSDPANAPFAEQDSANRPVSGSAGSLAFAVHKDGSLVHVLMGDATTETYQYARFDLSTDSWVDFAGDFTPLVVDVSGSAPLTFLCSITVRSSGEIVGAIQGERDKSGGNDFERIDIVRSTDGITWTVEDATNDAGSSVHFRRPIVVLGASDRVHVHYQHESNNDIMVSTLLSNNTWGSRGVVAATDMNSIHSSIARGGSWVDGADTKVAVPYGQGSSQVTRVIVYDSIDTPSGFSIATAGDEPYDANSAGISLHSLAIGAGTPPDRHVLYSAALEGDDLFRDVSSGAGNTWGTDELMLAVPDLEAVCAEVYNSVLAVLYQETGGNVVYAEEPL